AAVALITWIGHPRGKRRGDILAGAYAVRISRGAQQPSMLRMPPHLAGWGHAADMRRLPDGLALAARQFLARTDKLHPESRARLGTELASQFSAYVAPPPPPGTHPEYFLVAVLAERRDREYAHALRTAETRDAEAILMHRLPHAIPDPEDCARGLSPPAPVSARRARRGGPRGQRGGPRRRRPGARARSRCSGGRSRPARGTRGPRARPASPPRPVRARAAWRTGRSPRDRRRRGTRGHRA